MCEQRQTIRHPKLRQLRADYLRDIRRLRRIVKMPPEELIAFLARERTIRFEKERDRLARRITDAVSSSPATVTDEQLQTWIETYRRRRPRELGRLTSAGLALRLQREHPELDRYSVDWLRQRLARLQEANPPATEVTAERHALEASS